MSFVEPNLLRRAKRNALRANLKLIGPDQVAPAPLIYMDRHGKWTPPPPAVFLDFLSSRGELHNRSCRQYNRDTFTRLYEMGLKFDDVLAKKPSPADHLRTINYRPRKKTTLSREVAPEEVIDVEYVDGWSLSEPQEDEADQQTTSEAGETGEEDGLEGQWDSGWETVEKPVADAVTVLEDGRVIKW